MNLEEARKLQEEVACQAAREAKLKVYDGLRCQVAHMYLDSAVETITREGATDDGTTPYILRKAYADIVKDLKLLQAKLQRIDTLDRERQIPCYTIEGGKLVKMKLDTLLKKLQEQDGDIE